MMSPNEVTPQSGSKYLNVMKVLISETFKRTLFSKRAIVMLLFLLIPVVISIIYYFESDGDGPLTDFAGFYDGLYLHILIPLVTLIVSVDLFHTDFKKKTISYILIRPVPRWLLYFSRLVGLILAEMVIIIVPVLLTFFIMIGRDTSISFWDDLFGFISITAIAVIMYSTLFTFLGIKFKHPLLPGLGIAFFWESVVSNFGNTIPRLTVMYYLRNIGHRLIDVDPYADLSNQASPLAISVTLSILFLVFCGLGIWSLYRKQLY